MRTGHSSHTSNGRALTRAEQAIPCAPRGVCASFIHAWRRWSLTVLALLALGLGGWGPSAHAQDADAAAPVRALIEAMAAGDAARTRAQFSPNATQAYGADGRMKSAAATARWLESDIIERNGQVSDPQYTVNGNEVTVRGQYSSRGYSSKADFLFTVDGGLITRWRMRY